MGALSTTEMVNDFKRSRLKAAELKDGGSVAEVVHGSNQERLKPVDTQDQAQAALTGVEPPPTFVAEGDKRKFCTCSPEYRIGTRRCMHCGLLINNA